MRTRRGPRSVVVALALVAAAAAPVGARAQAAPLHGGTLVVSVNRQPTHLDPLLTVNNAEYMLAELLYSGLTRVGPDLQPQPDVALRWTHNADLTQWTFELRQGVRFATGQELTSADVVATFEAILDPTLRSPGRTNVGPIASVEALGPYRVRFTTSAPSADLPVSVGYVNAKIVPASVLENDRASLETTDVGSGPYRLASFTPGQSAVLVRNEDYFLPGAPYLDRIRQVVYPDPTAEVTAFLNGEIDLIAELPIPFAARVARAPGIRMLRTSSGRYVNIVMNNATAPFDDPRVRRALQLALDRHALVDILLDGYGEPANDTPISPAYPYHDASLPPVEQNIVRARRLLAEAGHPNGLALTLYAANIPPIRTQLGVAVRSMAAAAGFDIDVRTIPYATYLAQVWRKAPFYIGFYNMHATEDGIFRLTFTSDSAWNESHWDNAAFDALVDEAQRTSDPGRRADLYARAQRLMQSDVPVIIPLFLDLLAAQHAYVHGYRLVPTGDAFFLDRVWLAAGAPGRR